MGTIVITGSQQKCCFNVESCDDCMEVITGRTVMTGSQHEYMLLQYGDL